MNHEYEEEDLQQEEDEQSEDHGDYRPMPLWANFACTGLVIAFVIFAAGNIADHYAQRDLSWRYRHERTYIADHMRECFVNYDSVLGGKDSWDSFEHELKTDPAHTSTQWSCSRNGNNVYLVVDSKGSNGWRPNGFDEKANGVDRKRTEDGSMVFDNGVEIRVCQDPKKGEKGIYTCE